VASLIILRKRETGSWTHQVKRKEGEGVRLAGGRRGRGFVASEKKDERCPEKKKRGVPRRKRRREIQKRKHVAFELSAKGRLRR